MQEIGSFILDQLLKMQWLSDLVASALACFGIDPQSSWGGTLHFFIYDTIKIVILLVTMIFVTSYIQSYFPPERSRRILSRFRGIQGNAVGALLGTVTPFCSCSSIPLFIGFTRAGLRDVQLPDFLTDGRPRQPGADHECVRAWRGRALYSVRIGGRNRGRRTDSTTWHG